MEDVYITDHKPREKKYHTNSKKEDEAFYKYEQSLKEYMDAPIEAAEPAKVYSGRYKRGSLAQKMFDPLAMATKNEDGTLIFEVE